MTKRELESYLERCKLEIRGDNMNCLECGGNISESLEDGINGSDFYICSECNLGFNVITSKLNEDGVVENE